MVSVETKQNYSTPGIKLKGIILNPGRYRLRVTGKSANPNCILWVMNEQTSSRILPRKTYLTSQLSTQTADFQITGNEPTSVSAGILFSQSFRKNDCFYLESLGIEDLSIRTGQAPVSRSVMPLPPPPVAAVPAPVPAPVPAAPVPAPAPVPATGPTIIRGPTKFSDFEDYDQLCDRIAGMLGTKLQNSPVFQQMLRNTSNDDAADDEFQLDRPLISVIMTNYNNSCYLQKAIDGILQQDYKNIELIIVDDCSTDESHSILTKCQREDSRVKLLFNLKNVGTYASKNYGMVHAKGDFITFQDSDDWSYPSRLTQQYSALQGSEGMASVCHYIRVDEHDNLIPNRGVKSRLGLITLMIRRAVLEKIGYFDSVRTSADDEYLERLKTVYGRRKLLVVNKVLYKALFIKTSLTNQEEAINLDVSADSKNFLSNNRKLYADAYKQHHQGITKGTRTPYMKFPQTRRLFAAPDNIIPSRKPFKTEFVSASVVSIPNRAAIFGKTIDSIIDQVDQIYVYLNNYDTVPQYLIRDKINVIRSDYFGDLNDNGKFFFNIPQGYHLTIDDDIEYPPNYVQTMILKIEQYQRKAIVGLHGTTFHADLKHFFINRTIYSYKNALETDKFVNMLGTATVALHTDLFNQKYDPSLKYAGMVDVWLAIMAKRANIPMVCISRQANWLKAMKIPKSETDKAAKASESSSGESGEKSTRSNHNLYDHFMEENISRIQEDLCDSCKMFYKQRKFHKIIHCDTCSGKLTDSSDPKHTKYINDEGNWDLMEQSGIQDLVKTLVIDKRYPKYVLKTHGVDLTFCQNLLRLKHDEDFHFSDDSHGTTSDADTISELSREGAQEQSHVPELPNIPYNDLFTLVLGVGNRFDPDQPKLGIYLNHGKDLHNLIELEQNELRITPLIEQFTSEIDWKHFKTFLETEITGSVVEYLADNHAPDLNDKLGFMRNLIAGRTTTGQGATSLKEIRESETATKEQPKERSITIDAADATDATDAIDTIDTTNTASDPVIIECDDGGGPFTIVGARKRKKNGSAGHSKDPTPVRVQVKQIPRIRRKRNNRR